MIFQLKHVCRWNVYLCPCFCCAPVTRPGNLLDWLVNYSPGDLPNLFLIPFSSWNRSSLERQTWHLKDVWRLILAGRPTTSLDATWNPTLNPVVPANFFNTGHCIQVTLWGLCKQKSYLSIDMKIHFVVWCVHHVLWVLAPICYNPTVPKAQQYPYNFNQCIFVSV